MAESLSVNFLDNLIGFSCYENSKAGLLQFRGNAGNSAAKTRDIPHFLRHENVEPLDRRRSGPAHLWVVQSRWLESVCAKWGLSPDAIIDAADPDALHRLAAMMDDLLSQSEKRIRPEAPWPPKT